MKSLVSKLGASDWAVQMDALNNLRALAVYHASATIIPQLHAVIRAVLLVVELVPHLRHRRRELVPKPVGGESGSTDSRELLLVF
mgnify:CR=1 FL=1